MERALADIGDDDLDDQEKVKPVVDGFVGKNKALIVGDDGGGGGTPPKDGAGGGSAGVLTVDKVRSMDDAEFIKNKAQIWAQSDKIK
jgi:hypothetical protein